MLSCQVNGLMKELLEVAQVAMFRLLCGSRAFKRRRGALFPHRQNVSTEIERTCGGAVLNLAAVRVELHRTRLERYPSRLSASPHYATHTDMLLLLCILCARFRSRDRPNSLATAGGTSLPG